MDPLASYILPIGGLEAGVHHFDFEIDDQFLSNWTDCPYEKADVRVEMAVEVRPNLFILEVFLKGKVGCECDRCTADIMLPIENEYRVYLKQKGEIEDNLEDEIIYIEPGTHQFRAAELLYDILLISVPMQKVYDCEDESPQPCDLDILDRLEQDLMDETDETSPSIWDEIRNKIE